MTPAQLDPERQRLIRSVFVAAPLREVAEAVAAATEFERQVYVARFGDLWRWSLVHPGSGYPLLRITARFLKVDHGRIIIGFRTLDSGLSILCADPAEVDEPDASVVLEFEGPVTPSEADKRIVAAFRSPSERPEQDI